MSNLCKQQNLLTLVQVHVSGGVSEECTLVSEIAKARQHLKNSLERVSIFSVLTNTQTYTHTHTPHEKVKTKKPINHNLTHTYILYARRKIILF